MKYIVYKTTNLINGFIYIGVHGTKDPDVFDGYLGCGVNMYKPSTMKNPKTCFQLALLEFGLDNFKRETLTIFDNAEDAYNLEKLIVNQEFLARADVYNMVLGGGGDNHVKMKCFQYSSDGTFMKEHESITKASMEFGVSTTAIYNSLYFKNKCCGYYWSSDKLDKLDLSLYKCSQESTCVSKYSLDGKFIQEYGSLTQASDDSGCTLIEVARSARLGYRVKDAQFCFVKADSYDKAKSIYIKNRSVYKYDINGFFIKGYESQKEAELDNKYSNITKSIKNKKPCDNGFLWSLEELPRFCSMRTKRKKVGMFDLNGNLVKEYDSIRDWKKDYKLRNDYIRLERVYKNQYIFRFM